MADREQSEHLANVIDTAMTECNAIGVSLFKQAKENGEQLLHKIKAEISSGNLEQTEELKSIIENFDLIWELLIFGPVKRNCGRLKNTRRTLQEVRTILKQKSGENK